MTKPRVYELDFDLIKEPDDLWAKLFFAWLKNLTELDAMDRKRINSVEQAVAELDKAFAKLQPEPSEELAAAMSDLRDLPELWKQQTERSLDNVEKIAVICKQIVASQQADCAESDAARQGKRSAA